jgi:hypothetical protein
VIKFSRDMKIPSVGQELVETAREWAQTPSFGLRGHERLNILLLSAILENQIKMIETLEK